MWALFSFAAKVILANTFLDNKWESVSHIYSTYNDTPGLDHYYAYGPWYDENIRCIREQAILKGRQVNMLEIGVQSGGSTRVWKRYFRGLTDYVGLDINPKCRMFQSPEEGIRILTGSQTNTTLLSEICDEYGPFDLVVDDGGHHNEMIKTSLKSLWSCMRDRGVYVIEDLHTINMPLFWKKEDVSIFQEIAEWMRIRSPNIDDTKQIELKNHSSSHLAKIAFYDSIMFLHYRNKLPVLSQRRFHKGSLWVRPGENLTHGRGPEEELLLSDWCEDCCIGCYDN